MSRSRPLGVSLIALLFLVEAILALGIAAFLLLNPSSSPGLLSLLEDIAVPAAMGSLLAVPPLLTAALAGLIFRGLWEQCEWARVATIVLAFLLALIAIVAIAFQFAFDLQSTSSLVLSLTSLLLAGGSFLYLLNTHFVESPPKKHPVAAGATPPSPPPSSSRPQQTASPGSSAGFVPPPPRVSPALRPLGQDATVAAQTAAPTQKLSSQTTAKASSPPVAWLAVENDARSDLRIALYAHQHVTLGRDPARADAVLNDPTVSGRHAEIRYEQGRFVIYDLNSTNGTYHDEYRVQRYPLGDGDVIQLGNVALRFTTSPPDTDLLALPLAPTSPV